MSNPREALAEVLNEHRTVATGLGEWCCRCSPATWQPSAHRAPHMADVILREWLPVALADERVVVAADDAVCDAMIEDGPDGHIDGHDVITRAALTAAVTALTEAATDA